MYKPRFAYTTAIVNELAKIERLYGRLTAEKLIPSLAIKLSQENQILATHHSTSIEGNPLSPADVTNIVLGDQIPTTKSQLEVKNYFGVLNHIFILAKKNRTLDIPLTKSLHAELMKDLGLKSLGEFRNSSVFIGHKNRDEVVIKHNPPYHSKVEIENSLKELYLFVTKPSSIHPLLIAAVLHHRFVYLHPFLDGNGRLARILTAYFLLLKNYEVVRYFVMDDYYDIDRELYSDTLHSADNGNSTRWLEYFLMGIAYSLQAALSRIDYLKRRNLEEIEGEKRVLVTAREEDTLQIVVDKKAVRTKDIVSALDVTRQQAHALLHSLVKKSLLIKYGRTKNSYYRFATKKD